MHVARGFDVLHEVAAAPPFAQKRRTPAADRLRLQALQLARNERLVQAGYSYRIVPLDASAAGTLRAEGEELLAPRLLPASGQLTAIACCVCTIGSALEQRVGALFAEQRVALATALDELGNELLSAVARRAHDRMHAHVDRDGLTLSGELRPGDPGLALSAQPAVLRLAGAHHVGVMVSDRLLMHPHKSTSMVLGVGIGLPPADWSRCDECPKQRTCRVAARARAERVAA